MKYEITEKGVYDQKGEMLEVGSTIEVKGSDIPNFLLNKTRKVGAKSTGSTPVTNEEGMIAKHKGGGKYMILNDGTEVQSGLSKGDAEAFNGMSDEDKAAYIATLN